MYARKKRNEDFLITHTPQKYFEPKITLLSTSGTDNTRFFTKYFTTYKYCLLAFNIVCAI